MIEHPEPGEVVWCDDAGVTCRRWNWRQASRTQLTEDTTAALFILDALEPMTNDALYAAADELVTRLAEAWTRGDSRPLRVGPERDARPAGVTCHASRRARSPYAGR